MKKFHICKVECYFFCVTILDDIIYLGQLEYNFPKIIFSIRWHLDGRQGNDFLKLHYTLSIVLYGFSPHQTANYT